WSVLIALEDWEGVALGVCYLAEQGQMYWGVRGGGAYRDGQRLTASHGQEPAEAVVCVNALHKVSGSEWGAKLMELMGEFRAVRCFGGCVDATLVASGRADAWIEPSAFPWDLAALKVIAEEAGAAFFNFDGGCSIYGGNCVIAARGLEGRLRQVFGAGRAAG
ncbi:MAG: inositol monophosphatase family protein, partial [Chloroflexaceae bacterium]